MTMDWKRQSRFGHDSDIRKKAAIWLALVFIWELRRAACLGIAWLGGVTRRTGR